MRSPFLVSLILGFAALGAGCVVATAPANPAEAHAMRNGFYYLGERLVNGGMDHDVIHVGRRDGRFHEIMIVVERALRRVAHAWIMSMQRTAYARNDSASWRRMHSRKCARSPPRLK